MTSGIAFLFFVAKRKKIYIPGLENNKHLGYIEAECSAEGGVVFTFSIPKGKVISD